MDKPAARMKKIIYFVTEDWYFWSHRLPIAKACLKSGMNVGLITRVNKHADRIKKTGIKLFPIHINRSSLNPIHDMITLISLIRIYIKEKPDIVHHVALKPVIYGSWVARISGVQKVVNALAGLGEINAATGFKSIILKLLIRLSLKSILSPRNMRVIFQNPEDLDSLIEKNMITHQQACLIKGSGVDTQQYSSGEKNEEKPIVLMASRMLWSKGVGDFAELSKRLKQEKVNVRMVLVGKPDEMNPAAVSKKQLLKWNKEKTVEWWGHIDNMPSTFKQSSIAVLPTAYGEGIPKFLIEAASAELPMVTYDVPGCREIVRNNENGYLVPFKDISAMADAIKKLLKSRNLREHFGKKGRKIVKKEFSEEIIVKQTLALYQELLYHNMDNSIS